MQQDNDEQRRDDMSAILGMQNDLRTQLLRKVGQVVEERPSKTSEVIKSWLLDDE